MSVTQQSRAPQSHDHDFWQGDSLALGYWEAVSFRWKTQPNYDANQWDVQEAEQWRMSGVREVQRQGMHVRETDVMITEATRALGHPCFQRWAVPISSGGPPPLPSRDEVHDAAHYDTGYRHSKRERRYLHRSHNADGLTQH